MKQIDIIKSIKESILNGKKSYKEIDLPLPQRTGTNFQQNTYAQILAEKIYEEHFNDKKINI